ncbi:Uncharacterized protein Rs2_09313 [Raphanus sativus]|nr:Uncharacterized protein Rs2_09313 [Raphanus sativus]
MLFLLLWLEDLLTPKRKKLTFSEEAHGKDSFMATIIIQRSTAYTKATKINSRNMSRKISFFHAKEHHIPNYPLKRVQRPNGRDVKSVVAKARTQVAGSTAIPPLPPSYEHLVSSTVFEPADTPDTSLTVKDVYQWRNMGISKKEGAMERTGSIRSDEGKHNHLDKHCDFGYGSWCTYISFGEQKGNDAKGFGLTNGVLVNY